MRAVSLHMLRLDAINRRPYTFLSKQLVLVSKKLYFVADKSLTRFGGSFTLNRRFPRSDGSDELRIGRRKIEPVMKPP